VNLMRTLLAALSTTTLAVTLSACGISTLGGGGGDGGSGATGGTSGAGGGCEGPNPADLGCAADADCGAEEVCSVEGCAPSYCGCDPATGQWACSKDCGPACVPAGGCPAPDPSVAACATEADCAPGETCDETACVSSSCDCDATTGQWLCTDDCRPACAPASQDCDGPNPADGACYANADCAAGETCEMAGCQPSDCTCADGQWVCTDDCAGTCTASCLGENPQGCVADGCPEGEVCMMIGCVSSSCGCDPSTGQWICTDDCGGGTCVQAP
jgi:hypothetical protein